MHIKWLGHSCFLLTSEEGTRIITDPYEPGSLGGAIGHSPLGEGAEIVLVSHEHQDHNYSQGVLGNPEVVRDSKTVGNISFQAISSFHDPSSGAQRGRNRVFCFELDGMRICHCGDLGHVLSEEQVRQIGRPDVLFIPVGGTFTIDAAEATQVVGQLQARVVIPMHFKTPKIRLPLGPIEQFLEGKENVERLEGSELSLSADELPEQKIIVLQPAK